MNGERLARWSPADVARALQDPGIVRHPAKLASVVNNARCAVLLREECGLSRPSSDGPHPHGNPRRVTLDSLQRRTRVPEVID